MSRPPRAQRPQSHQQHHVASPPFSPSQQYQDVPQTGISFQEYESGDRAGPLPPGSRQRRYSAAIEDPQSVGARVNRKRSLVRPERERIEPGHRQYHYRHIASQLDENSTRNVMPSSMHFLSKPPIPCLSPSSPATGNLPTQPQLRRGKSLLARDQDVAESGLSIFKRSATLRRNRASSATAVPQLQREKPKRDFWDHIGPGPKDAWMIYCWILTCCIPPFLLSTFGTFSNCHHPSPSTCAPAQLGWFQPCWFGPSWLPQSCAEAWRCVQLSATARTRPPLPIRKV
jgi:chitin synthase